MESGNILLRDFTRGVTTRLVEGPGIAEPIMSPDGRRVAYSLTLPPRLGIGTRSAAGGAEDIVFTSPQVTLVEDWSRDGRFLLGVQNASRGLIIPLDGDRTPVVFADLPAGSSLDEPRFSPDGKWLVYNAADSGGRQEVYLVPVPPTGERWQLSVDGGAQGRWRADGRVIFYLSASGRLMQVDLRTAGTGSPQISRAQPLFETGLVLSSTIDQYAPGTDGTRFLLRRPVGNAPASALHVIVNWPTMLNQSAPATKPN